MEYWRENIFRIKLLFWPCTNATYELHFIETQNSFDKSRNFQIKEISIFPYSFITNIFRPYFWRNQWNSISVEVINVQFFHAKFCLTKDMLLKILKLYFNASRKNGFSLLMPDIFTKKSHVCHSQQTVVAFQ